MRKLRIALTKGRLEKKSVELFEKIKDMALYVEDPEPYRMSMYDPKKGNHTDNASTHELINCSLNSQRSIAYRGIAKYFWEHKDYAMQNKHFIDSAIQDSHPAVQIVAVEMLSPFLNYDPDFALEPVHNLFNNKAMKARLVN